MTKQPWAFVWLWTLYERIAMGVGLLSLALMCMIWAPLALVLYAFLPNELGARIGRFAIAYSLRIYILLLTLLCACRFDLSELDRLKQEGPLIIAANHPSILDAVLILARLPNLICVAKASLMDSLLFGSAARLARYIRNDSAMQLIGQSHAGLRSGAQVLIFPEGTRTTDFPINPLTSTLSIIAQRSQTPVQTVILEFSTPYLGKAWPLMRRPVLPLLVRARLGQRFEAPQDYRLFTNELEAYFRSEFAQKKGANHHD